MNSKAEILFFFALAPALSIATDQDCPTPLRWDIAGAREAPEETYSVEPYKIYTDEYYARVGEYGYEIFVDLEYGESSLGVIVLVYVSNEKIVLQTYLEQMQFEKQSVVDVIADPTISDDVRLYWVYRESGKTCPGMVTFELRLSGERFN